MLLAERAPPRPVLLASGIASFRLRHITLSMRIVSGQLVFLLLLHLSRSTSILLPSPGTYNGASCPRVAQHTLPVYFPSLTKASVSLELE